MEDVILAMKVLKRMDALRAKKEKFEKSAIEKIKELCSQEGVTVEPGWVDSNNFVREFKVYFWIEKDMHFEYSPKHYRCKWKIEVSFDSKGVITFCLKTGENYTRQKEDESQSEAYKRFIENLSFKSAFEQTIVSR